MVFLHAVGFVGFSEGTTPIHERFRNVYKKKSSHPFLKRKRLLAGFSNQRITVVLRRPIE